MGINKGKGLYIVLIAAVFIFQGCRESRTYEKAEFTGDAFQVDSTSFKEKTPAFYSHTDAAKAITFFVVKVNGQMLSFFDICNSCKYHNLGYRADKSFVECRNCRVTIPYEDLKTGIGGCYPIPLPGRQQNGMYTVTRAEILRGKQFFP
ncbi:MAG: DUF2318 domain-containing protein [Nitrospirae bacterium]|nr:DUF2318 domain-containing protein [Nitrospirota bacterium]